MLRLALIENLRRVGARIATGTIDRNRADAWADQMMGVALHDPKSLILVIADMARSNPPMVSSFVAELARRLQGQSAALALPLTWIEQRLPSPASRSNSWCNRRRRNRPATRSRSATPSAVFAFWARWTGASSSKR